MASNIYVLQLQNSYCVDIVEEKGKFVSGKEGKNHGWGIENVREVLFRNSGSLEISYTAGVFFAQVTVDCD